MNESAPTGNPSPVEKVTHASPWKATCPWAIARTLRTKAASATVGARFRPRRRNRHAHRVRQNREAPQRSAGPADLLQKRSARSGDASRSSCSASARHRVRHRIFRGEPALPMLLVAVSLAVAAIPEAPPGRYHHRARPGRTQDDCRTRRSFAGLPAVETLGSVTFICSDKTGTLTANEMKTDAYYCNGKRSNQLDASPAADLLLRAMAISRDATTARIGAAHRRSHRSGLPRCRARRRPRSEGGADSAHRASPRSPSTPTGNAADDAASGARRQRPCDHEGRSRSHNGTARSSGMALAPKRWIASHPRDVVNTMAGDGLRVLGIRRYGGGAICPLASTPPPSSGISSSSA